ncbi:ABC transporter substrate-binding protein [Granulicella sibirica]|uniref:Periplasmic binding protein n=1 Tax=Granulicella sibirica TaxID=2479048 RepID=A0A4Q0SZ77_9BACT|nr:ABC transporter substrate-binding protein [Granulicella sibirica]RXH55732.1 periplasmic binding protein [Granulicella sibirica]
MRIASLQPSVTLILASLGRLDDLCAHTKYCLEALPGLSGHAVLKDAWSADTAELEALRPDLVIASIPYRLESLAAILKAGLPVLTLAPHTLADVANDIRLIASIVHADPEPLVHAFEAAIADVRARTASLPKPLVYCEEWGKPLIHSQHWAAELIEAAGGRFLGVPGLHTTPEIIADAKPDVLLFAWCGAGNRVPLTRVIDQRNWHSLEAVRQRRVFCIPDRLINTPAPTLLEGLADIAHSLHPGIFSAAPDSQMIRLADAAIAAGQ